MARTVQKSDAEWRAELTPEQYRVLRQKGTELPYSGEFVYSKEEGVYKCSACDAPIFKSEHKYDSTTPGLEGWPSFSKAIPGAVEERVDTTHGMIRTEVICSNCGSHLGHVFEDDSAPDNTHYCINSVCLGFRQKGASTESK